jgi:ArsR family transcriptional regulator
VERRRACENIQARNLDKKRDGMYTICDCLNIQEEEWMVETVDGFEVQAQFFRALSHPVRLRILDILSRQEACVCHLTAILEQRQPYVSQQLATLREAGLVADRREGTLIYYRLADAHLGHLLDEGKAVVKGLMCEQVVFPPAPAELEGCPCPRCQGQQIST